MGASGEAEAASIPDAADTSSPSTTTTTTTTTLDLKSEFSPNG